MTGYAFLALALASLSGGGATAEPHPPEPAPPRRRPPYNYAGPDQGYLCPECGSRGWGRYCTGRGHHRRRVRR
jgi:hypothetical protein